MLDLPALRAAQQMRRSARALRGYATRRENMGDEFDAKAIRDMADAKLREADEMETAARKGSP